MKYLPLLLLAGCSSLPAFRKTDPKSEEGFGYVVKGSDRPEIFDVRAFLPEGVSPEFRASYLMRAAGEECLARGSMFFDLGSLGTHGARVICHKRPSKRSLGVVLDQKTAKTVIVEDIVPNSHAPFKARDVLRKVGGVDVDSVGAFNDEVYRLAESGRKEVTVVVERSGIALSLEAPFSEEREAVQTPEALEALRRKVP
jgi:hypothetical protein